jgi:hypothetical protein
VQLAKDVGIPESDIMQWDLEETKKGEPAYFAAHIIRVQYVLTDYLIGGPFQEIVEDADIFVNCIYLSSKIPPFVDAESLSSPKRRLSVVCDVSADTYVPSASVFWYEYFIFWLTFHPGPTPTTLYPSTTSRRPLTSLLYLSMSHWVTPNCH